MEAVAYISLGSNIGNSFLHLKEAVQLIHEIEKTSIMQVSSVYETDPVGMEDQEAFLNMVVEVKSDLNPQQLLAKCLEVENHLGRKRVIRWGPRTIDLDILLYNADHIKTESLIIPHPRMHERSFVLIPLLEINPSITHPIFSTPFSTIQQSLGDHEGVRIWKKNVHNSLAELLEQE